MMSGPTRKPSLAGAQSIICSNIKVVGSETIGLQACLHRVIRRDTVSRRSYPAADLAALDGYCLRAADTRSASAARPVTLAVRGTVLSGDRPGAAVGKGECVGITTGGVLPEGGDAVIPVEEAGLRSGRLLVRRSVRPASNVNMAGGVAGAGEVVAGSGDFIGPGLLALLAAVGIQRPRVSRRVRIGIVVTGNEMVEAGTHPMSWQIRDSNSIMLSGLAQELGCEIAALGIAGDTTEDIARRLRPAGECDLVILTGGSSAGVSDLVPAALESHGCRIIIRGIRLRPGKHVIFARKGGKVFFGLPGRPGGCFGLFHLLVRPAVMAMMGAGNPIPAALDAVWCGRAIRRPEVDTLLPVYLGPSLRVRPVSGAGSGDLAAVARSNSLALLRAGTGRLKKGERLKVFPLRLP